MTADAPAPTARAVTHVMAFSEVPGQPVFSGAENHLVELMVAQVEAGFRVRLVMIVVFDGAQLQARMRELRSRGIAVHVVHHRLGLRRVVGPVARLAVLPQLVNVLRQRPDDVVNTHLPQASQLGRLAAVAAGCRHVVDSVHNDDPAFRSRTWRARYTLLDRFTSQYIAISESVCRLLVDDLGLPSDKVHVVPYGIAQPGPEPDRVAARRLLGLPPAAFVIGFVGRLTAQKNLPLLLHALAAMPDAIGILIGGGEDEGELRAAAREGSASVLFAGSRDGAASLMRAFDVFCLPSLWEGLGLVLLEAMSRGVPIVGSSAGAIPEVLANGDCGLLFPSGDLTALVAALSDVRSDPAGAAARAGRARARVAREYSVEQMVERVGAVYARA